MNFRTNKFSAHLSRLLIIPFVFTRPIMRYRNLFYPHSRMLECCYHFKSSLFYTFTAEINYTIFKSINYFGLLFVEFYILAINYSFKSSRIFSPQSRMLFYSLPRTLLSYYHIRFSMQSDPLILQFYRQMRELCAKEESEWNGKCENNESLFERHTTYFLFPISMIIFRENFFWIKQAIRNGIHPLQQKYVPQCNRYIHYQQLR